MKCTRPEQALRLPHHRATHPCISSATQLHIASLAERGVLLLLQMLHLDSSCDVHITQAVQSQTAPSPSRTEAVLPTHLQLTAEESRELQRAFHGVHDVTGDASCHTTA